MTVQDIKSNYQVIESTVVEKTKRLRQDEQERYKPTLEQIEVLKKFLKSEAAQRKETGQVFQKIIDKKSQELIDFFKVEYMEKIKMMRERLNQF